MAQKLYNDTAVQDIADAIREKNGEPDTTKYKIADMGDAIRAIPSGGEKLEITDASYYFNNNARINTLENVKFNVNGGSCQNMFFGATGLTNAQIQSILNDEDNTFSNVSGVISMFYNNTSLTNINLNFTTGAAAPSASGMFSGCTNLQTVTTSDGFNLSSVWQMQNMFKGCSSLSSIDLSIFGFGNSKIKLASNMFENCTNLTSVTFPSYAIFQTDYTTDLSYMFSGCTSLQNIVYDKAINTYNIKSMFKGCTSLQKCELTGINCSYGNANGFDYMFDGCTNLKTIKIGNSSSRFKNITKNFTSSYIFRNCSSLESVVINHTGNAVEFPISSSNAFTGCKATCKFYVPDAAVNAYKKATNWSSRAAYIFPLSEYVEP